MLTVTHIMNGQEYIYLAPYGVVYTGPHAEFGCGGNHLSIYKAEPVEGFGTETKALYRGSAYVMNDAGATIGSYDLGEPPENPAQSVNEIKIGKAA